MIPEGERPEWAEYAWTLWAAEGKSTRMIAEQLRIERGIRVSHVTVAELVKEGREATELPTRTEVVRELHTATRHVLALLFEDHRLGNLTTGELTREVVKVWERRARLFGADAPAQVPDDAPAPSTPDAILDAIERYEREQAARRASGGPS